MNAHRQQVPTANRGLNPPNRSGHDGAIVDFLVFTAPWVNLLDGYAFRLGAIMKARALEGCEDSQYAICDDLLDNLTPGSGLTLQRERRGFRNFYENHYRILTPGGDVCGFIAFGGARQKGTFCMQLTGAGCAHVTEWAHVAALLDTIDARLTRVDCAYDDYEGVHGVDAAWELWEQGEFTTNGRPPAAQRLGWTDNSGRTVYIGKNVGNQQLCVYEKGRQLGARDGDADVAWVRWEGRFGAKYRDIPFDILTSPGAYLAGHYPVMASWLADVACRMKTNIKRARASFAGAVRHAKRQYGGLLHVLRENLPADEFGGWVAQNIARSKIPDWAKSIPFSAQALRLGIPYRDVRGVPSVLAFQQ